MANISNISIIIGAVTALISILSIKSKNEDTNQNKNGYKNKNKLKEYRQKNKKTDRKYNHTNKKKDNQKNYKNYNLSEKIGSKLEELDYKLSRGNSFDYENNSDLTKQVQSILKSRQEKNTDKSKEKNKNTNKKSQKNVKDKETFQNKQNYLSDNKRKYSIEDIKRDIEYEKPIEFDLKTAMIYSEILQKPLSIRNKTKIQ